MLATTVLLTACVHDTDDFNLTITETGASLTYYVSGLAAGGEKTDDDPWDTVLQKFDKDSNHTGGVAKNNGDGEAEDPWDTIAEKFFKDSNHTGTKDNAPDDPWDTITDKFGKETLYGEAGTKEDDPENPWGRIGEQILKESTTSGRLDGNDAWERIMQFYPSADLRRGKTNDHHFLGFEKSAVVFVSFDYEVSTAGRARVAEVRGNVLKLEYADGVVRYVIDAPVDWTEGTQLETGFWGAVTKQDLPFLGVRFWRTVEDEVWENIIGTSESLEMMTPDTVNGVLVWPDPWGAIKSSSGADY